MPTPRPLTVLMIASLAVAAALALWILRDDTGSAARGRTLTVHCAAGIKGPVAELARAYEAEFGTGVRLTYGGSGTLLSSLAVRTHGDLYIAGDDSYLATARQRGVVDEVLPLATMRPVVAVRRGNPAGITGLRDLLRSGLKVGLGNPEAAAVGRITAAAARELGIWDQLSARASVFKPTVTDLGNDLRIGTIDAAVIWDATARQFEGLDIVTDEQLSRHPRRVAIGVLRSCTAPAAALHFARYLGAPDRGGPVFARHGFHAVDGDAWADVPRLRLMSGAMLRPAIAATIKAFEAREGVAISEVYNGCGILVSQMKTGTIPDAYFSCDQTFLDQVQDRFHAGDTIASNDIVMLVAKGNPRRLNTPADLLTAGLRVGLGHPEKSALGALTAALLRRVGLADRLAGSGNVAVESATGDLLVNQLVAGSLDVVLVYRSNTAHVRQHCDVVGIDDPAARATQPYAVARDSRYPLLMGRLLAAIRSADSRSRFRDLGFEWHEARRPR